eukprot:NODE_5333_length_1029_cov_34.292494_g4765_i0.p1 GENE.NODE_5333_length_1029_cov_34.292494_g4765_i0~~NODE_5333_length_1029_cov_34.292494_g4765_i0.p1  ORF type:complete len:102 (-),score=23.37 NODE_5333_length_1029_cov_34.292494_g4765_i0:213-518(-)
MFNTTINICNLNYYLLSVDKLDNRPITNPKPMSNPPLSFTSSTAPLFKFNNTPSSQSSSVSNNLFDFPTRLGGMSSSSSPTMDSYEPTPSSSSTLPPPGRH